MSEILIIENLFQDNKMKSDIPKTTPHKLTFDLYLDNRRRMFPLDEYDSSFPKDNPMPRRLRCRCTLLRRNLWVVCRRRMVPSPHLREKNIFILDKTLLADVVTYKLFSSIVVLDSNAYVDGINQINYILQS